MTFSPGSSVSTTPLAAVLSKASSSSKPQSIRPGTKDLTPSLNSSRRRALQLGKDLRHLNSRGANAALTVEKADTRFDPPPRFDKPPEICYSHRAQPALGCNEASDRVLADVLYGRPMSALESRRIQDNRHVRRKHVGPSGGREHFVASFQQDLAQVEAPDDVEVARRVLLTSGSEQNSARSLRQQPWFQQDSAKVSARTLESESPGRTPRLHSTPRNPAVLADGVAEVTKAVTASPAASSESLGRLASTRAAGLRMHLSDQRAWAHGSRGPLNMYGGRPPPSSRPPPSTLSALSTDNLLAHEQKLGDTPRSASQRSRRSGSQASSHSSLSSTRARRALLPATLASGRRSESCHSERSAASAPPRRIEWNKVIADAELQGESHRRRSHSVDVTPRTQASLLDPTLSARRLRKQGTERAGRGVKDLLAFAPHGPAQVPYKPLRRIGGAPPPRKGHFDATCDDTSPQSSPYRRMRGCRSGTPPPDKLSMPVGDQSLSFMGDLPNKLYPARPGKVS